MWLRCDRRRRLQRVEKALGAGEGAEYAQDFDAAFLHRIQRSFADFQRNAGR